MRLQNLILGRTALRAPADDPPGAPPAGDPVPATPPASPPTSDPPSAPPVQTPPNPPEGIAAAPKPEDWRDKRIAELTRKLNEERKKAPPTVVAAPPAPVQAPGETQESFDSRVRETASQMVQINEWNRKCDDVASTGRTEFQDFNTRLAACQSVVNSEDPAEVGQFNSILAAAMETGQAHRLLHSLGETPGEVTKLMRMSPLKMAVELERRAAKFAPPAADPEPSNAPKPITPIGSRGVHYDGIKADDPVNGTKLPIGEWMKQREKQASERGLQ